MAKRRKENTDETIIDIVETRDNLEDFFNKNSKLILGIVGVIILAVAGYFIWKYAILVPREKAAVEQIFKAEELFAKDSFALALERPGAGYESLLEIIDNYKGTKTANTAKYYAGVSYLNLGRFEDAIDLLSDVKVRGDILPIMKYGTLADAYSENGDMDKAKSNYQKAVNAEDNDFLTPYYLEKLALLHLSQGEGDQATKYFNRIKNEYPSSKIAEEVEKFIQ